MPIRNVLFMTKSSLSLFIAGLLGFPVGFCQAADPGSATAYTALRSMGKSLGDDALTRVVEVTGRGGTPQPTTWRIVISEGSRGTREVKVAGAQIVSQKASIQTTSLKPIRLEDLNLDSSGAFDAANTQARKARVPFTSLNYDLRVSDTSNKPVWDLELVNDAGTHVGGVRLAAHDGKLLSVNGLGASQPSPVRPLVSANADHDSVQPTRVVPSRNTTTTTTYTTVRTNPPPSRNPEDDGRGTSTQQTDEGGFFSRAGRTLDHTTDAVSDTVTRTGHAVDRTMRRTGAKLQRFFTGQSDQDQRSSGPD